MNRCWGVDASQQDQPEPTEGIMGFDPDLMGAVQPRVSNRPSQHFVHTGCLGEPPLVTRVMTVIPLRAGLCPRFAPCTRSHQVHG